MPLPSSLTWRHKGSLRHRRPRVRSLASHKCSGREVIFSCASHMTWTETVRIVGASEQSSDVLRFIRFSLLWPGPPLRLEVVGARWLPRIKRATWKGRNPRPCLALCMLSQTVVAAATTVTWSDVVPVALKCRQFQNQSRYPWCCMVLYPRRVSDSVG